MEYRVRKLIMQFGSYETHEDIETIHNALQEHIRYDLEEVTNESIADMLDSLRKCDCCGEYEHDIFMEVSSLVLDKDGNHGRICDYCRGLG